MILLSLNVSRMFHYRLVSSISGVPMGDSIRYRTLASDKLLSVQTISYTSLDMFMPDKHE